MPRGIVKWFCPKKGFGFITYGDEDLFVHHSEIQSEGYRTLDKNEPVEFEIEDSDKGSKAVNVRRLNPRRRDGNNDRRSERRKSGNW